MAKSQIWKKKANYPKNKNKIDLFLAFRRKAKMPIIKCPIIQIDPMILPAGDYDVW